MRLRFKLKNSRPPAVLATLAIFITYVLAGFSVIAAERAIVIVAAAIVIIFVDTLYWQPRRFKRAAADRGWR